MNYIYDILLNFQKAFYDFYEWNEEDEIIHIRKIPLFRVSNPDFNNFKNNTVKFDKTFTEKIYNRTEKFKKINIATLNYVFLVSNSKEAMALKLGKNGVVTHKSSLLIDEEDEIADMANDLKLFPIEYSIVNKGSDNTFQTRNEKENSVSIINKLNNLYTHKDDDKLKFLYLECFNKKEEDATKAFNALKNEVVLNSKNYFKISDFFKIISQK